jgi:NADH:ubiquinone oxidoreductase subunit 2 (subunit N)
MVKVEMCCGATLLFAQLRFAGLPFFVGRWGKYYLTPLFLFLAKTFRACRILESGPFYFRFEVPAIRK